ncbi:MAG: DNA polymerase III subunit beta [Candidatus Aureabacteria bacterium]|nr:DNA polymerase III subunit beta [Candidatus Auribacterota bacterium]
MKFQCKKADIITSIQQVQNIVGQRTTLQILSNLLIEAKSDHTLTFTATDLEIGIVSSSIVEVSEEGRTTIPAKKLFDIVRNLPEEIISFETDEDQVLRIQCGKSFYRVFGLAADEYPALPDFADSPSWEFDQSILRTIIRNTNFAISRDESRYVLNGIYLVFNSSEIIGVATDGRRLSLSKRSGMNFKDTKLDFIIPAKTVNELIKLLTDEGSIKIHHKGNQVSFIMGKTTLVTKLIEGNFPEYQAVIPADCKEKVVFNNKDFTAAIQRVSILTSDKTNSIKFVFRDNKCIITANSPNIGEAREEIDVQYKGQELQIAFNPLFLLDILRCLEEEDVTFELNNSLTPGLIRHGVEFLSVIMPMRLTE